jgi:hypothetical protein
MTQHSADEIPADWQPWKPILETIREPEEIQPQPDKPIQERLNGETHERQDTFSIYDGAAGLSVRYTPHHDPDELMTGWLWTDGEYQSQTIQHKHQQILENNDAPLLDTYQPPKPKQGTYHVAGFELPTNYNQTDLDATVNSIIQVGEKVEELRDLHREVDDNYSP